VHPITKRTYSVRFQAPRVGKPLKEDAVPGSDPRLFPRDCREAGTTYKAPFEARAHARPRAPQRRPPKLAPALGSGRRKGAGRAAAAAPTGCRRCAEGPGGWLTPPPRSQNPATPPQIDVVIGSDGGGELVLAKRLGAVPIMARSAHCYLRGLSREQLVAAKEEANEARAALRRAARTRPGPCSAARLQPCAAPRFSVGLAQRLAERLALQKARARADARPIEKPTL